PPLRADPRRLRDAETHPQAERILLPRGYRPERGGLAEFNGLRAGFLRAVGSGNRYDSYHRRSPFAYLLEDTPMGRILGILVLVLGMPAASAAADGQDKTATPAEQYEALRKEYDRASSSGVPLTDAERLKFVGR